MVWGLNGLDGGGADPWDPSDLGTVKFDSVFDISAAASQAWMMSSYEKLKVAPCTVKACSGGLLIDPAEPVRNILAETDHTGAVVQVGPAHRWGGAASSPCACARVTTWGQGQKPGASVYTRKRLSLPRYVIRRIFNPRLLSSVASYDAASIICQTLRRGVLLLGAAAGCRLHRRGPLHRAAHWGRLQSQDVPILQAGRAWRILLATS